MGLAGKREERGLDRIFPDWRLSIPNCRLPIVDCRSKVKSLPRMNAVERGYSKGGVEGLEFAEEVLGFVAAAGEGVAVDRVVLAGDGFGRVRFGEEGARCVT